MNDTATGTKYAIEGKPATAADLVKLASQKLYSVQLIMEDAADTLRILEAGILADATVVDRLDRASRSMGYVVRDLDRQASQLRRPVAG